MAEQLGARRAGSRRLKSPTPEPVSGNGSAEEPATPCTAEERHHRIAEAAYFHAERRGLQPGFELGDWLEAERNFDAARERSR